MGVEKYLMGEAKSLATKEGGIAAIGSVLDREQEQIVDFVVDLRDNVFMQKLSAQWDKLSDKKKQEFYENGASDIWHMTKRNIAILIPSFSSLFSLIPSKNNFRENVFKQFTPMIRMLVHLGIFSRPVGLQDDVISKNIASDRKNIDRQVWIFEKLCYVIPELMPLLPEVKKIRPLINIFTASQEKILLAVHARSKKDDVITESGKQIYKIIEEGEEKDQGSKDDLAMAA